MSEGTGRTEPQPGYRALPGSSRRVRPGTRRVADAPAEEPVEVTVVLRRASDVPGAQIPGDQCAGDQGAGDQGAGYNGAGDQGAAVARAATDRPVRISRSDAARLLGADPADVRAVQDFAQRHGLAVSSVDLAARTVVLVGTVALMNAAFGVDLGIYQDGSTFRGREGAVHVPADLIPAVVAVLGLDNRRQARTHFRRRAVPAAAELATGLSYPPQEVARRYRFPAGADGSGQTVAVIELGGGYRPTDLQVYFAAQGLRTPQVSAVAVGGVGNAPGGDADAEVALDVEVIGAIAQGARQVVYFGPNTTDGFYNAIAAAVHDQSRAPSVISISWGGPEPSWTGQALDAYDALFADAAALGVSVFVASGDDGATDNSADGTLQVDFPAASPQVVSCGGTSLGVTGEVVWNGLATGHGATGGGVSRHFGRPDYQQALVVPVSPSGQPGRGVPDVAGNADPLTGYQVRVDGVDQVIGGTSAVAPLWAALTAILNQITGRPAGDLHAFLYGSAAASGLLDITEGTNGYYPAAIGWDPCTGLGTPIGDSLAQGLAGSA